MKWQVNKVNSFILLILAVLFAGLGKWQLERKIEKQELLRQFEQAEEMPLERAVNSDQEFARVRILGHFEAEWHLLVDNRVWKGQPGVHVLSLFHSKQGIPVLVNRGWLAMNPDRRSLPEVVTPEGEILISGLLSRPPQDGVQLGQKESVQQLTGPVLLTYLDIATITRASGLEIAPQILKLDASDPSGFEDRKWQPAVILPAQHQAYAVQWFALAVAAVILLFTMGIRISRGKS
ncbi:MAG TPA: SURF1 family protein [Xanthomonadales bacterium]|nr:SURF1 family protein [Xanthomonadales bacterium]